MLKNFLITLVVFLGIDSIWLGVVSKNFYSRELSTLLKKLDVMPALLAYFLIAFGIVYFVLPKAGTNSIHALLYGSLFGLISYGVYDLTNLATLSNWSLKVTLIDMLWGCVVCGITSFIVVSILNKI